jgi:hypothetical protein
MQKDLGRTADARQPVWRTSTDFNAVPILTSVLSLFLPENRTAHIRHADLVNSGLGQAYLQVRPGGGSRAALRKWAGALLATGHIWCAQGAQAQVYVGLPQGETGSIVLSNFASDLAPEQVPTLQEEQSRRPMSVPATSTAGIDEPDRSAVSLPARTGRRDPASEPKSLYAMIVNAAREHGVGADLIAAVAAAESRFNARAQSPRGAQGIMQLTPATARRFGVQDVWSVEDNLRGGAAYLRWLLDYFGGDTTLAVAAYNAGEQSVVRAGHRIPSFEETRRYVPMVLAWRAHYASNFDPAINTARSPQPTGRSSRNPLRIAAQPGAVSTPD